MKKFASLMLAILLVAGLANPAYAKSTGQGKDPFVPSITYKGKPSFVTVNKDDKKDTPDKDKDDKDKNDKDKNDKDDKADEKKKVIIGVVRKETPAEDPQKQPETVPTKPGETTGKETVPGKQEAQGPASGDHHEPGEHGEIISYVYEDCLVVTPVAEVDTSADIPKEDAETLRYVYEEISEGRMELPYEDVEGYNGEDMVVTELMDISWLCKESLRGVVTNVYDHDHHEEIEPEGVVFEATLDIGVAPDANVIVMTYNDGKWNPIAKVVNNGDGTITCTFEHFCPVAISIGQGTGIREEESGNLFLLWVLLLMAALAGMVVVLKKAKKKQAK